MCERIERLAPWVTRISSPEKPGRNWIVHFQLEGPWCRADGHRGVGKTLDAALTEAETVLEQFGVIKLKKLA